MFLGLPKTVVWEYNMGISSHFPKHLTANRLKGINYMELIVISESKLKIMLSAPDMEHYNLQTLQRYQKVPVSPVHPYLHKHAQ